VAEGALAEGHFSFTGPFQETRHYVVVIKHRYSVLRTGRIAPMA
jgi:hypothetical protein